VSNLVIDSITIPTRSLLEYDQQYQEMRADDFRRVADGSGVLRTLGWAKLRTTINAKGWVPLGLAAFRGGQYLIKCAAPHAVDSASNVITLPAARRSDTGYDPYALAQVDGDLVETTISDETGDVFTLATVSGATGYRLQYYPEFTAVITDARSKGDSGINYTWSMVAEQV